MLRNEEDQRRNDEYVKDINREPPASGLDLNRPYRDANPDAPCFIDLFCGCGGISLGFVMAGWRLECGVDLDLGALKTFQYNLGNAIMADVRYLPFRPGVCPDALVAGPPCQPWSSLMRRKGYSRSEDPRTYLPLWYAIAILELQPKFFMMENVPGLEKHVIFEVFQRMVKLPDIMATALMKRWEKEHHESDSKQLRIPMFVEMVATQGTRSSLSFSVREEAPQNGK